MVRVVILEGLDRTLLTPHRDLAPASRPDDDRVVRRAEWRGIAIWHPPIGAKPWFTAQMARTLADILRDALADADARGVRSPTLASLSNSDVHALAEQTLAFLRTRPSLTGPTSM